MIRTFFLFLVTALMPLALAGQTLSVSPTSSTADNELRAYPLGAGGEISLSSGEARFSGASSVAHSYSAIGFSQDRSVAALVDQGEGKGGITLFSSKGDTLTHYSTISLRLPDPSLAVYPAPSGHLMLRENIMNFTFHNGAGIVGENLTAGSDSERGETMTEVVMSPGRETVILYTPKIKRAHTLGSKAELLTVNQELRRIFESDNRYLKSVGISGDGNILALLTAAEDSEDRVLILDKFGNNINEIAAVEDLTGIRLSDSGRYVTLASENRVRVYNTENGDRLGSTSLSDPVYLADYFPDDELLLILSGRYSAESKILSNSKVKAVSFEFGKIVSRDGPASLRFHEAFSAEFHRNAANNYLLRGANKELDITAAF